MNQIDNVELGWTGSHWLEVVCAILSHIIKEAVEVILQRSLFGDKEVTKSCSVPIFNRAGRYRLSNGLSDMDWVFDGGA